MWVKKFSWAHHFNKKKAKVEISLNTIANNPEFLNMSMLDASSDTLIGCEMDISDVKLLYSALSTYLKEFNK